MERQEFLQKLKEALSGQVPPAVVQENLNYYDDYIRAECGKGRTEKDVMEELGDPRLIARTILDTTPGAGEGAYEEYRSFGGSYSGENRRQAEPEQSADYGGGGSFHVYDLNKWYWKLLGVVMVILIVMVLVAIISGILTILIPMLPALIMVALIMWFVRGGPR